MYAVIALGVALVASVGAWHYLYKKKMAFRHVQLEMLKVVNDTGEAGLDSTEGV